MARRTTKKTVENHRIHDKRKNCLGCGGFDGVHDVDFMVDGSKIPHRSRLCTCCMVGREIVFDRGDVNEGLT